jgi:hypothetical protein
MSPWLLVRSSQAIALGSLVAGHWLLATWLPTQVSQTPRLVALADALFPAQCALVAIGLALLPLRGAGQVIRWALVVALLAWTVRSGFAGSTQPRVPIVLGGIASAVVLISLLAARLRGSSVGDPGRAATQSSPQFSLRGLIGAMLLSALVIWSVKWLREAEWVSHRPIDSNSISLQVAGTYAPRNAALVVQAVLGTCLGLIAIMTSWACLGARSMGLRLLLVAIAVPLLAYLACWSLARETDWPIIVQWFGAYFGVLFTTLMLFRFAVWPEWAPSLNRRSTFRAVIPVPSVRTSSPAAAAARSPKR